MKRKRGERIQQVLSFIRSHSPPYTAPRIADSLHLRGSSRAQIRRILSELSQAADSFIERGANAGEYIRREKKEKQKRPPRRFFLDTDEIFNKLLERYEEEGFSVEISESDINRHVTLKQEVKDSYIITFVEKYDFDILEPIYSIARDVLAPFYARGCRSLANRDPTLESDVPKCGRYTTLRYRVGLWADADHEEVVIDPPMWRTLASTPWFSYTFLQVPESVRQIRTGREGNYAFWFAVELWLHVPRNVEKDWLKHAPNRE